MNNIESVSVVAPARLHMGFLDPSASLNRKFGSIGLAINEISTQITVRRANKLRVTGPHSERVRIEAQKILDTIEVSESIQVDIEEAIPEHVGLGSGTQMSLAIGLAVSTLFKLGLSVRAVAKLTERGARSGIGIGAFEQGGLIVDGGRAQTTKTPPIIVRMNVPEQWRFILVFDNRNQGLNGSREVEAFQQLTSFPEASAARICHLLLMKGLPALAEQDRLGFGQVITEIQQSVGDYFSSAQGGCFMSPHVESAVGWLGRHGAVGLGQSSWGPTGFCLVENEASARHLVEKISRLSLDKPELSFRIVSAQNQGEKNRCKTHYVSLPENQPMRLNSHRS